MLSGQTQSTREAGTLPTGCQRGPHRAFTLIELLVVIAIIGILAALVMGVATHATRAKRLNRVKAELAQLVTAIDSYHSKLNNYPPANSATNAVNPLYYELVGMVYDPAAQSFRTVDEPASSTAVAGPGRFNGASVQTVFNQAGFLNARENVSELKPFHTLRTGEQKREITMGGTNAFVLAVPVEGNRNHEISDVKGNKLNPWRYVMPGIHSPKSYDLWAEVKVGTDGDGNDLVEIIGNWNSAK